MVAALHGRKREHHRQTRHQQVNVLTTVNGMFRISCGYGRRASPL